MSIQSATAARVAEELSKIPGMTPLEIQQCGTAISAWIERAVAILSETRPAMPHPAGPAHLAERAEARLEAQLDVINDFDREATAADYADYLTTLAWSKCGGHYNREGAALIGAAHMLLESAPISRGLSSAEAAALQGFLEHDALCPAFMEPKSECSCGLAEALKAAEQAT